MKISVIIPVLNEAAIINSTISHLRGAHLKAQAFKEGVQVIVVDGSPEGSTINAVSDKNAIKSLSGRGRSVQMNKGASLATGDVLLFLHVDTELPEDGLKNISHVMENGYEAGSFDLGIASGKFIFRVIERAASIRSRITRIPYGDQAIFIKRECFERLSGFREIPLMEDVDLMRRLKKSGGKICIIRKRVYSSPRRWEKEGVLYCTLTNWALVLLFYLGVSPERLKRFYR